jgi:catechol 2,3-dioxygenase
MLRMKHVEGAKTMTIDAVLERLIISTPQAGELAYFYRRAFGFSIGREDASIHCEARERSVWLIPGDQNTLVSSHFRLHDSASFEKYTRILNERGTLYSRVGDANAREVMIKDPEGRKVHFRCGPRDPREYTGVLPRARLQHYAIRTPDPQALADFYIGHLGFTPSDIVRDDEGGVSAAFLRTDEEHHALAIFRCPQKGFDHFSCEATHWVALRDWADHMGEESIPLAWGVGRHGPGNDTFFMVRDPDGNLAEISCDLEVCAPDRPVGSWPHRPATLNRWGVAIMRS